MAKKKKRKAKSSNSGKKSIAKKQSRRLPEGFWTQVFALALFLTAILITLAMFGIGGPMPNAIYNVFRFLFGWGAYIMPVVLLFLAFQIFIPFVLDDFKPRFRVYAGTFVFVWSITNILQLFVHENQTSLSTQKYVGGGVVGINGNQLILQIITSKPAAGLLLFALALVGLLAALRIPLSSVIKEFFNLFKREPMADNSELGSKSKKLEDLSGDEPEPNENKKPHTPLLNIRRRDTKAGRRKAEGRDTKSALTTTSDPEWNLPGFDLLDDKDHPYEPSDVKATASLIRQTFEEFNYDVQIAEANIGPRVTQYEVIPPRGVKLTKLAALDTNLALNLKAKSIRIEAPIPGKSAIGIEVPNKKPSIVSLRNMIESDAWLSTKSTLSFAVGENISGEPVVGDIASMPHLLIAGQTGSGKSVMINAIMTSLLYRNSPADLKFILVDPKQVELTPYNHIPHLLTPVITQPEKCLSALQWAANEMERRYGLLSESGKRNIASYNQVHKEDRMPMIVIIIDELADLMMVASRDVETLISRLAAKARAVGIHLIVATQRPSVDVITGLIKANIPSRIAFTTSSQVDSRTIIDQAGAEKLLGKGDMLMTTSDTAKPVRIQAVFVDDDEVMKVTDFVKLQRPPDYDDEVISQKVKLSQKGGIMVESAGDDIDPMFEDAVRMVLETGRASTSALQTRLKLGFGRASRIIMAMEEQGIIGPARGSKPREILIDSFDDVFGGENDDDLVDG